MTEKKLAMGIKTINQISVSLASAKTADIGMGSGATATSLDATELSITTHAWDAMQVIDRPSTTSALTRVGHRRQPEQVFLCGGQPGDNGGKHHGRRLRDP